MVARYQPPAPIPALLERLRRDAAAVWGEEAARELDSLITDAASELTVLEMAALDPRVDWPDLEPPCSA
jgi:hypothetical protein